MSDDFAVSRPSKSESKQKKPTVAHRAEYYAMRATISGLRALSWDAACAFGERLGALGYRPLGIREPLVERQIAAAFPELSPDGGGKLPRQWSRRTRRTFTRAA